MVENEVYLILTDGTLSFYSRLRKFLLGIGTLQEDMPLFLNSSFLQDLSHIQKGPHLVTPSNKVAESLVSIAIRD